MVQSRSLMNNKSMENEDVFKEKLKQLIHKDALTKLPNYHSFQEAFKKKWKHAVNAQEPISIALIDVDHLQYYNEFYGFSEGDRLLCKIGNVIESLLEKSDDILAHIEGGTFALILPNTDMHSALRIVEKMRQKMEALQIPHPKSYTSQYVTVSFGVGTKSPYLWEDPNLFLKAVDQALHKAKRLGRNQIIWNNVYLHGD